jgi:hypothetical protein
MIIDRMIRFYNTGVYERDPPPVAPDEFKDVVKKMVSEMTTKESSSMLQTMSSSDTIPEPVMDIIKRVVYTERGVKTEDSVLEYLKQSDHIPSDCVVLTPSEFFKLHCVKNNQEFFIGGRLDGVVVRKSNLSSVVSVIEIKSRQEGFLTPIPDYEKVQIECYMNMMHVNHCLFLQEYNGEHRVQEYTTDTTLWNDILEKMVITKIGRAHV